MTVGKIGVFADTIVSTQDLVLSSGSGFISGAASVVASAQTGSVSSTQTNMINYTPPAIVGTYRLMINVSTTSGTNTGTLTPSVAYAIQGGATAFAPNFMQTASATLVTTTTGASKNFSSVSTFTTDASGTAITLTMTVSGTVAAYISATLERLV